MGLSSGEKGDMPIFKGLFITHKFIKIKENEDNGIPNPTLNDILATSTYYM